MSAQSLVGGVVVGISTHNRASLLRKAIQSALDQSYRPLRIAVVDDGSVDETPALQREFEGISWERVPQPQGYVRARNRMMLEAAEPYYVSLDDDAWFIEGDEIALAVRLLEAHPKVAAVAFDILSPDEPQHNARGMMRFVPMFIGCGHVLRLSVVKELGGYREFPRAYGSEEKDLCLRLIDAGYEIVKMNGVHVWHDKSLIARDRARQHASGVCNDLTLTLRRVPLPLLPLMIAHQLVSHLTFSAKRGLIRSCMQGIGAFGGTFADAWAAREPVRFVSLMRYRALTKMKPTLLSQIPD